VIGVCGGLVAHAIPIESHISPPQALSMWLGLFV
jgi:hypothetical protein